MTAAAAMAGVVEAATSAARVSRGLPLPGRRRQRAAGERIAALFEEHGRMVYGVSRLFLRDPVEAEDAAQQTFLSAYRSLLAGQEPRDPSAWLGTIARNECRARLRARQAEPLGFGHEPAGDEVQRDVDRREEIHALCAALTELPSQQRDAVVLREFYGLSYAEVAAALGLSGAAVESLLFRGRKRLQEQLRPMRSALGVLTLPITLRESLGQALPGFGAATASTGAGGAVLAKLAALPLATKLAAATLAVGTVGTVAGVEQSRHAQRHRLAAEAHRTVRHARVESVEAAVRTREPMTVRQADVEPVVLRRVHAPARLPQATGVEREQHTSSNRGSGGGEVGQEHSAPAAVTSGGGGREGPSGTSGSSGHESGGTSPDGGGDSGSGSSSGTGGSGSGDSGSGSGSGGLGDRGTTGESGRPADGGGSGSGH